MAQDDITFDRLLTLYAQERDISTSTARHFESVIRVFTRDTGISEPKEVTREDILLWKHQVIGRIQVVTWNNYFRHLRCLWNYALENGYLNNEPFVNLHETRTYQRKHKTVTTESINQLLAYLQSEEEPLKPGWFWVIVIKTFYYTGMRRRQLAGMVWSDLNFTTKVLRLRAETSKSRREWSIPISDKIIDDLYLLQEKTHIALPKTDRASEQVFNVTVFNTNYAGDLMHATQITGFFKRLMKKTGISIGAHRLRHTTATQLVANGSLTDAQEFLGHTDIKVTAQYIHPDIESLRKTVNNIPDLA